MVLDRVGTSRAIEAKFGTMEDFNSEYFLHLVDVYLSNDKPLYHAVRSEMLAVDVAKAAIVKVVECDAIEQDEATHIRAAKRGIVQGVGGHSYYVKLLRSVVRMVEAERREIENESTV